MLYNVYEVIFYMKRIVFNAISAAMMISIVSYCNLVCGNSYVGALLFAFGLIVVCAYSMNLFTGMAGYITKSNVLPFVVATGVNCVTAFVFGVLGSLNPACREKAAAVCAAKIDKGILWMFVSAIFCGILIYLGVDFFKKRGSLLGMIFAVPLFVACGFDHTVADMFYYGAAGVYKIEDIWLFVAALLGNIAGSNIIRYLIYMGKEKEK